MKARDYLEIPVIKVKTSVVGVEAKGNWTFPGYRIRSTEWHRLSHLEGKQCADSHASRDGKPSVFYGLAPFFWHSVYNSGYRHTHKVPNLLSPDEKNIMKHEENHLTLITCDTYDEKTGKYLRYVMVQTELVDTRPIK
jgi:hypothetical protein